VSTTFVNNAPCIQYCAIAIAVTSQEADQPLAIHPMEHDVQSLSTHTTRAPNCTHTDRQGMRIRLSDTAIATAATLSVFIAEQDRMMLSKFRCVLGQPQLKNLHKGMLSIQDSSE
jgi:hypothetical protein